MFFDILDMDAGYVSFQITDFNLLAKLTETICLHKKSQLWWSLNTQFVNADFS